jgi:hypothetical protein
MKKQLSFNPPVLVFEQVKTVNSTDHATANTCFHVTLHSIFPELEKVSDKAKVYT